MVILTPEQMQKMDKLTIDSGFPEILLMEEAGRSTAEFILSKTDFSCQAVIFCGTGNNGGDGLVVARFLDMNNVDVQVIISGDPEKFSEVSYKNYEACRLRQIEVRQFAELSQKEKIDLVTENDIIVDALLGTGIQGQVRGQIAKIIALIKEYKLKTTKVFSVDIPSGISGKTGQIMGQALCADYTVVMAFLKTGLVLYPGRKYAGETKIVDIGIPDQVKEEAEHNYYYLNNEKAARMLPSRPENGHKGTFGKLAVVGGTLGMSGAPYLAGRAALKMGAGLVKVAVPDNIQPIVASYAPEIMTVALSSNDRGIKIEALSQIKKLAKESDVLALGPGLGQGPDKTEIINSLLQEVEVPLVLDADALNVLAPKKVLKQRRAGTVLTPHPGEMARLMEKEISTIQKNRLQYTQEFAVKYGIYLVLKGATTTIGLPNGDVYFNLTGNQGLATGGSGDVLTGIIASLIAQGLDLSQAVVLGPYIHGRAGDLGAKQKTARGLTAGDLTEYLARAAGINIS
ncbi:MAG: NAD(P)H-hydrate dehydratase [Bacillota bacterium]